MRGAGRWAAIAAIAIGLSGCVSPEAAATQIRDDLRAQVAELESRVEANAEDQAAADALADSREALAHAEDGLERIQGGVEGGLAEVGAMLGPWGVLGAAVLGWGYREARNRNILSDVVGSIDAAKRADSDFADAFDRNAATIGSVQDKRTRKAVASVRSGA